ncbi:MAG: hypothetical protein K2O65_05210 [Lachnospiraceae bacterium]|nr:hypothetical protein [Lachnospiraceae bacterium]
MTYFNEQAHFVEYQSDSGDPARREAVMRMLEAPDSFTAKQEFYDRFADRNKEEAKFWHNMDQAFDQFAPNLDAVQRKYLEADIYASCEIYGIAPEEYFQFQFYWKNDQGRNQYIGDKERFVIFRSCYNFDEYEKIRNKWQMYQQIGQYFGRSCFLIGGGITGI